MRVFRLVRANFAVFAVGFLAVAMGVAGLAAVGPAGQHTSHTALNIAPNPAEVGQTVTFTAVVLGDASGSGTIPTGTVTFQVGSTQLGPITLDGTGKGTTSTSSLAEGSYQVTATYSGDSNYLGSTSNAMTLNIVPVGSNKDPSNTTLKIAPDPAMLDQTITFTAHVGAGGGITGQGASGTVTFLNGSTQLGTAVLDAMSNAVLSNYSASSLGVGTYQITAMYGGDTNFLPSTSPAVRLDVVPVGTLTPTTTTLSSSNPNADFGTTVTFSATVSAGFGSPPTGTVTFNDGTTEMGMASLTNGVATFSTSSLTVGTHSITGVYSGDTTFAGSTSAAFTQNINNSTSTMFILTVDPTTITVKQGNSGTATVTLIPSGGFKGTVTFLCSGLPIYSQCSFSPATITPDGNNTPSKTVMTVSTNVATARLLKPSLRRDGAVLAVFSFGLLGLVQVRGKGRRTRLGRYVSWFSLMLCLAVISTLVACGGSSSNNRVLTPTGTTTVNIAGSTNSGAQTTSFTLVVQ
jgi:hypothetical protein